MREGRSGRAGAYEVGVLEEAGEGEVVALDPDLLGLGDGGEHVHAAIGRRHRDFLRID
jgi:ATP-dependent protease HslVU (ClpYQ) peptidase subunit